LIIRFMSKSLVSSSVDSLSKVPWRAATLSAFGSHANPGSRDARPTCAVIDVRLPGLSVRSSVAQRR
jgi:hypothetical protein